MAEASLEQRPSADRASLPPWAIALAIFVCALAVDAYRIGSTLPRAQFGDEWRYIYYAKNLIAGFYSPHDRIFLCNGPGYPLFLVPFVKLGSLDAARYANAVLHAAALVYAWLILKPRLPAPWSFVAVALLGMYLPTEEFLPLLYTEVLCFLLLTAWLYHGLRVGRGVLHTVVAGVCLGVLTLTKVVFGYVLVPFLVVALVVWRRTSAARFRAHALAALLALGLCVPYLGYTYKLTGRFFYWNSLGSNSFYWLTSPFPDELGDWYHQGWVQRNPLLRAHHLALFDKTSGLDRDPNLSVVEQLRNLSTPETGDVFAEAARKNVREHPLKFAKNWLYNVVRLFLDVPVTVRGTPWWNPYSQSHLALLAFSAYVAVRARRAAVGPLPAYYPIFVFFGLSLAAYSLSSAVARYLFPLVPIWWLVACHWLGRLSRDEASNESG
ncbi:MAG TPA: glycosyltransferase family 39 protein [Polyangiaceae bacterium]|nr:glycosyltransferase family 39 protein [Polyangiaceae bacterium]